MDPGSDGEVSPLDSRSLFICGLPTGCLPSVGAMI